MSERQTMVLISSKREHPDQPETGKRFLCLELTTNRLAGEIQRTVLTMICFRTDPDAASVPFASGTHGGSRLRIHSSPPPASFCGPETWDVVATPFKPPALVNRMRQVRHTHFRPRLASAGSQEHPILIRLTQTAPKIDEFCLFWSLIWSLVLIYPYGWRAQNGSCARWLT